MGEPFYQILDKLSSLLNLLFEDTLVIIWLCRVDNVSTSEVDGDALLDIIFSQSSLVTCVANLHTHTRALQPTNDPGVCVSLPECVCGLLSASPSEEEGSSPARARARAVMGLQIR